MVAIRNSEVVRYWGGVNVQYKGQQTSVPELASAIWSESVIGGVRYWRFHCIDYIDNLHVHVQIELKKGRRQVNEKFFKLQGGDIGMV